MLARMGILQPIDNSLDQSDIAALVDRFYEKIRRHPTLGPVFNAVVEDWDVHKRLLTSFWCSVALRASSYRGNPMAKHRPLPITAAHFQDWLALWRETTREVLDEAAAERLINYAERIGDGLQVGLGIRAGSRPLNLSIVASDR